MQLIVFIALQIYSVHTNACVIGLDKLHVVFAGLERQTGKVERLCSTCFNVKSVVNSVNCV